jgi:hypothetical protein
MTWIQSLAQAKEFSFSLLCPDQLCGPASLLANQYQGSFPAGKARLGRYADHSLPSSSEVKYE